MFYIVVKAYLHVTTWHQTDFQTSLDNFTHISLLTFLMDCYHQVDEWQ